MKTNVDLTEDMKFQTRRTISIWLGEKVKLSSDYFGHKPEKFTKQTDTTMYMGNSFQRKLHKFCDEFSEPTDTCDACGALIRIPWKRGSGGLCIKCDTIKHERKVDLS